MKKAIKVITILAIVASFSSTAYAKGEGWTFLNTFFSGKGLDPNCTSINASPAQIFATKTNADNFTVKDANSNEIMSFTTNQ
ncbi:MAG TPA: hypothetical protein PK443_03020 [bacterium]|nr:hypothetical protein [bacterium]